MINLVEVKRDSKSRRVIDLISHKPLSVHIKSPVKYQNLNQSKVNEAKKLGVFNKTQMLQQLKEKKKVLLNYIVNLNKKKEFPKKISKNFKCLGMKPPYAEENKFSPVFNEFYCKYGVPFTNKDKTKRFPYLDDEEVRLNFHEARRKLHAQTTSMNSIWNLYLCSYTRKIRIQRSHVKHGTRLIKFSQSGRRKIDSLRNDSCPKHLTKSFYINRSQGSVCENNTERTDNYDQHINVCPSTGNDAKLFANENDCESCKALLKLKCEGQKAKFNLLSTPTSRFEFEYDDLHNTFKPSNEIKTSKPFRGIINFKPLNITTLSERENNPIRVIREAIRSKESSRCRELDDHTQLCKKKLCAKINSIK